MDDRLPLTNFYKRKYALTIDISISTHMLNHVKLIQNITAFNKVNTYRL